MQTQRIGSNVPNQRSSLGWGGGVRAIPPIYALAVVAACIALCCRASQEV